MIVLETEDPVRGALRAFLEAAAASETQYQMEDLQRMLFEGLLFEFLREKAPEEKEKGGEILPRPHATDEQMEKRRKANAAARAELAKKMVKESGLHTEEQKAALLERVEAWASAA